MIAIAFGTINVVGGFLVTDRMLHMFQAARLMYTRPRASSRTRTSSGRSTSSPSRCFILDLRLMNHPRTARRGNIIGAVGMAIAVVATLLIESVGDYGLIALGVAIGTAVGVPAARSVKMTAMPQMVALFNGVGGGAVALISWVEYREALAAGRQPGARGADPDPVRGDHRLGLVLGLEHRLRQAPGDPPRAADPAAGPAVHQHRPARGRAWAARSRSRRAPSPRGSSS